MTALSRTWASPLSSPQIEPLQNYNNASRSKSPDDNYSLDSSPQSPSYRIAGLKQTRAASELSSEQYSQPQTALFQLLQRNKTREQPVGSDDESESRRRSSAFGMGLFRGLPQEERQEQLKAEADFAFECPVCGNEEVQFWSRGRTAGQAECQSRTCGHRWMWKPTTKMVKEGTTFEPNMPLPPKQSIAPAPKRRKLKDNSSDMPPPSYSHGMYDRRDPYSSYYSKAPRRIPPELSYENPMNPYGNPSNTAPDYEPNRDTEFYENYERLFANRAPDMDPNSGRPMPFSSTKYSEPSERPKPQAPGEDFPIDEEDEIYQSELLELELRRREIEARREAHRARKSQLLLQQRREQLREQNMQRQRQSQNPVVQSDDNTSLSMRSPSELVADENQESAAQRAEMASTGQSEPASNQTAPPKPTKAQKIPRREDNQSASDGYMFSDEEEDAPNVRNGKLPMKEIKTVKPIVQVEDTLAAEDEGAVPRFAQDATMSDEDRMINEAYGYYFSDEEDDTALVAIGSGIRKQPVWHKVSDTEPVEDDENAMSSDSEGVQHDDGQVESEQRSIDETKLAPKKRGRKPNPNKVPKTSRDPNEPPKKRGRKPNPNKKTVKTKKPMNGFNPYLLFNRDMRKKLAEEHKGKSNGEISRLISEAWKSITPEEKQKYFDETNERRKELGLRACEQRDKNELRAIPNPFVLFNIEQRPQLHQDHPGLSLIEMNGLVTERWKALTEKEKQIYYKRFEDYKKELLKSHPGFRRRRRSGKDKQEQ
ncbi:hypothetical protein K450DRAFT_227910 [Umbelopsis ramanniana AG]|uniref:HMG box domain-containing protein n=1 Tax=Umbelopsis ramanniana AG TaxID=1314678 RepID=A0AAD5HGK9_UMBRA|nr:uncharacterized protein K450DRAFT_227910 [Umbelopsis ramanniana AG]KAI8582209.1 hypothetical protein K450DRAFT_227910 [Umbelopsis ramanniana AG]